MTQETSANANAADSRLHPALRLIRDVAVILLVALVVSWLIKTFLIRSFFIPSDSMNPTLVRDDRIIVNQLTPDLYPLAHGDVVVFEDPGGWLPSSTGADPGPLQTALEFVGLAAPAGNEHLIKRVVGLPGDVVKCCDQQGHMTINGQPLEEPYIQLPPGVDRVSEKDFEVTVPSDALWVMGDNRYNSRDSRFNQDGPGNGFVSMDSVVGRAIVISWPIDRWQLLDNYPKTFAGLSD